MKQSLFNKIIYNAVMVAIVFITVGFPLINSSYGSVFFIQYRNYVSCAVVLVSAAAVLATALFSGGFRFNTGLNIMLLFVAVSAAAIPFTYDSAAALGKCILYFSWAAVTIVTVAVLHRREYFIKFIYLFAAGASVVFLYGIRGELSGGGGLPTRETAMGISTAYGGCLLAYLFILQGMFSLVVSRPGKICAIVAIVLLIVSIAWCDSYSLWILAGLGELVLFFWWAYGRGFAGWKRYTVALVMLGVVSWVFVYGVNHKIITKPSRKRESVEIRLQRWEIARDMIKERPVFGHGPGQYEVVFPRYRAARGVPEGKWEHDIFMQYDVNAENILVMLLIENGIAGATMFLAVIVWSVYSGIVLIAANTWRSAASRSFVIGLVMIFLYAMAHYPFVAPGVWPVIWFGAAMLWPELKTDGMKKHHALRLSVMAAMGLLFVFLACAALVYSTSDTRAAKLYSSVKIGQPEETLASFQRAPAFVPATWRQRMFYAKTLLVDTGRADEALNNLKNVEKIRPYSIIVLRNIKLALIVDEKERGSNAALQKEMELYNKKLSMLELRSVSGE